MKVKIDKDAKNVEVRVDYFDLWSLDQTLAIIILPCLKKFKDNVQSYPPHISFDEWKTIIQKMITAFELIVNDDYYDCSIDNKKVINEGLKLFGEYYKDLWL